MDIQNKELLDAVLKYFSKENELTGACLQNQSSKDELIRELIISEATVKILKEKLKVLEWENRVWNSSDAHKVPGHFI